MFVQAAALLTIIYITAPTSAIDCYVCQNEWCNTPNRTYLWTGCSSCSVEVHYDIKYDTNAQQVFNRDVDGMNYLRAGVGCTGRVLVTSPSATVGVTVQPVWAAWTMPIWSAWSRERATCGSANRAYCEYSGTDRKSYIDNRGRNGAATGTVKRCYCYTDACNLQTNHGDGEGNECTTCALGNCNTETATYTNNCDKCFKVEVYNAKTGVAQAMKSCIRKSECEVVRDRTGCESYTYHDEEVEACYCTGDKCNSGATSIGAGLLLTVLLFSISRLS